MKVKMIFKRLDSRREDFDRMMKSNIGELKVRARMETGGYHKPGSLKK